MTERRGAFIGWMLFVVSACLFLASGLRSADPLSIAGSAFFLIACCVFLIPLLRS